MVFFNVLCVSRIFEFFTMIRRSVLPDARNYLAAKSALEALNSEQDNEPTTSDEVEIEGDT